MVSRYKTLISRWLFAGFVIGLTVCPAWSEDVWKSLRLKPSDDLEVFADRLLEVNSGDYVFLDAQFSLKGREGTFLRSEEGNFKLYETDCREDNFGPILYDDEAEFHFRVATHAIVIVYPGSRSRNPFNDVSCEYMPDAPGDYSIRIRGLYFAITNSIPTAVVVQLRPVGPGERVPPALFTPDN